MNPRARGAAAIRRFATENAEPLLHTAVVALLVVPATYAALRGYDVLFKDEPHPSTVGPSVHIAMFWRVNLGTWLALGSAPLVFRVASRDPAFMARLLRIAVPAVAAFALIQGLFLP